MLQKIYIWNECCFFEHPSRQKYVKNIVFKKNIKPDNCFQHW